MSEAVKETKAYTEFVTLRKIAMRIYNPQVVAAYTHRLDGSDEEDLIARLLYDNLQIKTQDTFNAIILRILIFYLLCSRLSVVSSTPMYWSVKKATFVDQLEIDFRPAERRKLGFRKYDTNPKLHIPHYNGDRHPKIPKYTVGQQSAKYTLKDQSYIMVNASTEEEAVSVVEKLAHYVKEDARPEGKFEDHLTTTKRKGKRLALEGRQIVPFMATYHHKNDKGVILPDVLQL
jgi:hypothetical protein